MAYHISIGVSYPLLHKLYDGCERHRKIVSSGFEPCFVVGIEVNVALSFSVLI
mgnify:CR=1 FL=1